MIYDQAHEHPLPGQRLGRVGEFGKDSDDPHGAQPVPVVYNLDRANVVLSKVEPASAWADMNLHKPLIDIDMPAKLIPSSTPGHFHLYIDKTMHWDDYRLLLVSLHRCGVISTGYLETTLVRGYTTLRLPWVKKGDAPPPVETAAERMAAPHDH